jgi:hypothetical protein
MFSLRATAELVGYIRELVGQLPEDWDSILLYRETAIEGDENISAENIRWWRNGIIDFEYNPSLEAERKAVLFYDACKSDGDQWLAMKIQIMRDGSYKTKFYYSGTPLLDGDHGVAMARLADGFE